MRDSLPFLEAMHAAAAAAAAHRPHDLDRQGRVKGLSDRIDAIKWKDIA